MLGKVQLDRFVDRVEIEKAIIDVERKTRAHIIISVAPYFWGSVRKTAELAFRRHRLSASAERNTVFFFVVPHRRRFAILGDVGAYRKVDPKAWNDIATDMQSHFRKKNMTSGLIYGIAEIGRHLALHFPALT